MMLLHVFILAASCVLIKIIANFSANRRFRAFAERHGCKDPEEVTGPFLHRFSRLRRIMRMKVTGEDLLDDIFQSDFEKAATVTATMFDGSTVINTIEPANLQAMLATQFKDFAIGHRRYNTFKPLVGHSIFTADGAFWEHSRALFRPQFARENINDLEATEKASSALLTAIGPTDSSGWTSGKDMFALVCNFTLDTSTDFLFGESVGSQQAALAGQTSGLNQDSENAAKMAKAQEFADSFSIASEGIVKRLRLQSLWWLGDGFEFRDSIRNIREFTEQFVQLACDTTSSPKPAGKKQSLLNNLATQTQNQTEIRDQVLSILLAGRDTTASMLGWCLARLALHPDVFTKLRSIVLQHHDPNEPITFAKLKGCRYLQHFLNEVLRLHPTVPVNQRMATKNTTIPAGGGPDRKSPVAVRKGQVVLFSVYLMQRRKDLWGEDALEFKPERWEQRVPAWQFLPFLGGPRICLGQQFALTEASFLLVRLLQRFDSVEPVDRMELGKLKKGLGVTMWPLDVNLRFHRSEAA